MHTKYYAKFTLFCLTDPECDLNLPRNLKEFITLPPSHTTPEGLTVHDDWTWSPNITTPFQLSPRFPDWSDRSSRVDGTNTLMILYAIFNVAWAVTCIIAVGKWKERAAEDSMLYYNQQYYRETFQRSSLP
jgi:hypothetical protein